MYTSHTLPSDGTRGPFTIGFDYLEGETIHVYSTDLDGYTNALDLPFKFQGTPSDSQPSGTQVVLDTAVIAGKMIVIRKVINLGELKINWAKSASLNRQSMLAMSRNLQEMAQAAYDRADAAYTRNQEVIDAIHDILPDNIIEVAQEIHTDRIAAETAASNATSAVAAALAPRFGTEVVLDFGAHAYSKTFVVDVPDLQAGTPVRVTQLAESVPGRDNDENEADAIMCRAMVLNDEELTIYADGMFGAVHGQYRFVLTY